MLIRIDLYTRYIYIDIYTYIHIYKYFIVGGVRMCVLATRVAGSILQAFGQSGPPPFTAQQFPARGQTVYAPSALSVVILAQVVCSGSSWAGASAWDWQWRRLPCGRHRFDHDHHHPPRNSISSSRARAAKCPTSGTLLDSVICVTFAAVENNWRRPTCVRTGI